jgi:hypothetical protein
MIAANELRIRNWVKIGGIVRKVIDISFLIDTDVMPHWEGYLVNSEHEYKLDPIPLTPEILEKCGFDQDGKIKLSYIY